MRKTLVASLFGLLSVSPALAGKPAQSNMKTAYDSTSYALGVQVGMSLKGQLSTLPGKQLDYNLFIDALSTCLKSDSTKLQIKPSQTPVIINKYMQEAQEQQNKADKAKNDAYLANNAKQPGVIVTKSGLQYEVLKDGDPAGEHPKTNDKVKVRYTGKLIDGKVFDTSEGRGDAEFELSKVIKGWTEGIQLMTIGSKYRFTIPPELAYGQRAISSIPANSILVFDVELVDIGKATQQGPQSKFSFKPYQK